MTFGYQNERIAKKIHFFLFLRYTGCKSFKKINPLFISLKNMNMATDLVEPFVESIRDNTHRLASLAAGGRKIIGYFCTYTPVEIIHAAGFIPMRITGGAGHADKATAHLPDFICPFMKMSFEKALNGRYRFVYGLVQGYSCDAACGTANIWKDVFNGAIFHPVPIPYNDSPESRKFLQKAYEELIENLNAVGGTCTETSLAESINLYARIRKILIELYNLRYAGQLPISSSSLMAIIDAGFLIPPEEYLRMLVDFMTHLPVHIPAKQGGVPILISGSLIESPHILDIVESCGGRIMADDLCNGFRQIFPPNGRGESSMNALIDRYISRFPCPARNRAVVRSRELLNLMKQSNARGVIFILQKFCTPHLADFPTLSLEFKKNGFPSLLVEMDESWQMESQLKTRLESFFEMLGG